MLVHFSGDGDVHWGCGILTHGHVVIFVLWGLGRGWGKICDFLLGVQLSPKVIKSSC